MTFYEGIIIKVQKKNLSMQPRVKPIVIFFLFSLHSFCLQAQTDNEMESKVTSSQTAPKLYQAVELSNDSHKDKQVGFSRLPRIETKLCAFVEKYNKYQAECGTLYVQENPDVVNTPQAPARATSIPIMIFQPQGEVSGDPLVITGGGGPGSAVYIMDGFDGNPDLFYNGVEASTLQNGRQLIVMEMRGSGESLANLDCPAITNLEIDFLTTYPYKWDKQRVIEVLTECAKTKRLLGVDVNFYNTDVAIRDVDALRVLLGIEKWHLLGISHGTRISLQYAKTYPEHTASLVLDSIYPFEVDAYTEMPFYAEQIFTQPFKLCDADPSCRLSNGDASISLFETFMQQLKTKPVELEVEYFDENWGTGPKNIKVSPELVAYALYSNSYEVEAILAFPNIVKDALNKDYKKLIKFIGETIDLQNYTWFSEGAYASYACYEEIPFSDFSLATANAKKYKTAYWSEESLINLDQQICKIWNIKAATNQIKKYDHSILSMPVLILSGDLDPFTPVKWAVDFHQKLPFKNQTQHLRIWPLKAHNLVYDDACVESVLTSFLNEPRNTIENDCALKDVAEVNKKIQQM
ncbi:MAG: pimeloyl-ACP methyl ester carboxylesterase [Glaciecola sp.]